MNFQYRKFCTFIPLIAMMVDAQPAHITRIATIDGLMKNRFSKSEAGDGVYFDGGFFLPGIRAKPKKNKTAAIHRKWMPNG